MKGILLAAVLAVAAAVLWVLRAGAELELPEEEAAEEPKVMVVEEHPAASATEARSNVPPPPEEPAVVEEPPATPEVVEHSRRPELPEWKPRVSEFIEAGLTQLQAEWLVGGLEGLQKDLAFLESAEESSGSGLVLGTSSRLVLQMGPTLASLIKEKKVSVKSVEWLRPQPGGAMGTFGIARANDGKLEGFTFTGRDSRGAVTLDIPLDILDRELLEKLKDTSAK